MCDVLLRHLENDVTRRDMQLRPLISYVHTVDCTV